MSTQISSLPVRSGHSLTDLVRPAFDRLRTLLLPLASLKLTVALFGLSFLLILVGTLAQYEKNMVQVMADYFRTFVAWVEFRVFFPASFFPNAPDIPGGFYFPGGKTIGLLLMVNLVAAHALRFKVQADGPAKIVGWLVTAAGIAMSVGLILAAQGRGGVQGEPWLDYGTYWRGLQGLGILGFSGLVFWACVSDRLNWWSRWGLCAVAAAICLALILWGGSQRLSDASMRILWLLGQAVVAAGIVLAGSMILFRKRGGVVTIHLGVALLMIGELIVSLYAVEEQMMIREGSTVSFARDQFALEIAFVDRSHPDYDKVVSVPVARLKPQQPFPVPELGCTIELEEFFANSTLEKLKPDESPRRATAGVGLEYRVQPARPTSGADVGRQVDLAAAYVRVSQSQGDDGEVYLLSRERNDAEAFFANATDMPESIRVGGRDYEVALRARRSYKPYAVELIDVRKDDYLGTNTPRDYSSFINLSDPDRNQKLTNYRIWMNNPLRYNGETFYQSSYSPSVVGDPDRREATTLSLVTNDGWIIPYLACAYVAMGMLFHFAGTLRRFLARQVRSSSVRPAPVGSRWVLPVAVLALFASFVVLRARPPDPQTPAGRLAAFGKIPILFEGRAQPIDTLARNTLRVISNKQSFRALAGDESDTEAARGERQSAIQWLLGVAVGSEETRKQRVFKIDNLAVQNLLDVPRRKRALYSIDEIGPKVGDLGKAADEAAALDERDPTRLTVDQRKIMETANRLRAFVRLSRAFETTPFPELPTKQEQSSDPDAARKKMEGIASLAMEAVSRARAAQASGMPLIVPGSDKSSWLPFGSAVDVAYVGQMMQGAPASPWVIGWSRMLEAYSQDDWDQFQSAVAAYRRRIQEANLPDVSIRKVDFEATFNHLQPFILAMIAYGLAFVTGAVSWIRWYRPLQQGSYWLVVAAFLLHTLSLVARIYISGRPPVTNLYSSAIFIGWAMVICGLIAERFLRLGFGQLVSAVSGFATLVIAHNLAGSGDTFTVLQAVLDTQFWLATHVVSITLGYGTTFLAGQLGIAYLIARLLPKQVPADGLKLLGRVIYGTTCFAMFFSFVGTVLGGLWADDSWGRFWGWDPKENGALMIVLWNAILLHARWDGLTRDRGTAVLAILGNIVTAWSWYGVNELGIGLHSYGFTEGVLWYLAWYVGSQILVACLALVPIPRGAAQGPVTNLP